MTKINAITKNCAASWMLWFVLMYTIMYLFHPELELRLCSRAQAVTTYTGKVYTTDAKEKQTAKELLCVR